MSDRGGIEAGKAYVTIYGDKSPLARELKTAGKEVQEFGKEMKEKSKELLLITVEIGAVMLESVRLFSEAGDVLGKMSERTGVASSSLATLGYAAKVSGSNLESLEGSIKKQQKFVSEAAEGNLEARDTLDALGLSIDNLKNMSTEDQLKTFATAIDKIENATTRAAFAMKIFGRGGTQLLPMFKGGGEGIEEKQRHAVELGLVVPEVSIAKAVEIKDKLDSLLEVGKRTAMTIGEALTPAVGRLTEKLIDNLVEMNQWIAKHGDAIESIAGVVGQVGLLTAGVYALGTAISLAGGFLANVVKAVSLFGRTVAFVAEAIAAIVAGLVATIVALPVALGAMVIVAALSAIGLAIYNILHPEKENASAELAKIASEADRLTKSLNDAAIARARLANAKPGEEKQHAYTGQIGAINESILALQEQERLPATQKAPGLGLFGPTTPTPGTIKATDGTQFMPLDAAKEILAGHGVKAMPAAYDLSPQQTGQTGGAGGSGGWHVATDDVIRLLMKQRTEIQKTAKAAKDAPLTPDVDIPGLRRKLQEESDLLDARAIEDPAAREKALVRLDYAKKRQTTPAELLPTLAGNEKKELDQIDAKSTRTQMQELADLRNAAIVNEYERELQTAADHYDRLIKIARAAHQSTTLLEQQKSRAIANLVEKSDREMADRHAQLLNAAIVNPFERAADEIRQKYAELMRGMAEGDARKPRFLSDMQLELDEVEKRRRESIQSTKDQIDALQIEADGRLGPRADVEKKLLELQRRQALRDAPKSGQDLGDINRLFDLKKFLLDIPKVETRSALSSFAIQTLQGGGGAGGSAAERTAKATEKTATLTERVLKRLNEFYGPEFAGP